MGFRELDKNGDGTLDLAEIKDMFLKSLHFRENFQIIVPSGETFEDVLDSFLAWFWKISDVDGDGRITFEELKVGLGKFKSSAYKKK